MWLILTISLLLLLPMSNKAGKDLFTIIIIYHKQIRGMLRVSKGVSRVWKGADR